MDTAALITELTDKIQRTANVRAVFGEPLREGPLTIIPVARIAVRGGGGGKRNKARQLPGAATEGESGTGMGLGMNIVTVPVGYIKAKEGEATFVSIVDKNKAILSLAFVLAVAFWATGGVLRKTLSKK